VIVAHLPPYRVEAVALSLPPQGIDWNLRGYNIPSLWTRYQGEGVRVGILDSGVDPTHPALQGAVVEHRNFTKDCDPYDTNGHGTHVCGVLAARGPLSGVAPKAEVVSCKVLNHSGSGSMESIARAVEFCLEVGCRILVLSLGAPVDSDRLALVCEKAYRAGVVTVAAAGNDGGPVSYPAAYDSTIAVGAVDREGLICEFSCRGKEIDVAAPGAEITSSWVGGRYATLTGTSMAAPFVAGVFALATARWGKDKLAQSARLILQSTSCDRGEPGHDHEYGWGLINPSSVLMKEHLVL
jgi:subtilisin family serine protease